MFWESVDIHPEDGGKLALQFSLALSRRQPREQLSDLAQQYGGDNRLAYDLTAIPVGGPLNRREDHAARGSLPCLRSGDVPADHSRNRLPREGNGNSPVPSVAAFYAI